MAIIILRKDTLLETVVLEATIKMDIVVLLRVKVNMTSIMKNMEDSRVLTAVLMDNKFTNNNKDSIRAMVGDTTRAVLEGDSIQAVMMDYIRAVVVGDNIREVMEGSIQEMVVNI